MELRPMKKSDLEAYGKLCQYCFGDETDQQRDRYMSIVGEHLTHTWGAFEQGVLQAGLWYYPYEMRVGDLFLSMGGVAAVVSRPESRSQGLVRLLMTRMHQQMRSEKRPLGVLMPFKSAFYFRMGYADVFFLHEHLFEPSQIARRDTGQYTLREIDGIANWELLEELRLRCSSRYTGTVRRDAHYWQTRALAVWQGKKNVYLVERHTGAKRGPGHPVGFLITTLLRGTDRFDLRVNQAIWEDPSALNAILQFMRNLRDQVKEVRWFLPLDVDLFPHFEDPKIKVLRWPKMMLKLVDLKGAIEGRRYHPECNGELLLDVQADETSSWNGGKWRVRWASGSATVRKVARETRNVPGFKVDIQTLAVIYSGHRTASSLARDGLLQAPAPAITLVDRAFPAACPHMEEWF